MEKELKVNLEEVKKNLSEKIADRVKELEKANQDLNQGAADVDFWFKNYDLLNMIPTPEEKAEIVKNFLPSMKEDQYLTFESKGNDLYFIGSALGVEFAINFKTKRYRINLVFANKGRFVKMQEEFKGNAERNQKILTKLTNGEKLTVEERKKVGLPFTKGRKKRIEEMKKEIEQTDGMIELATKRNVLSEIINKWVDELEEVAIENGFVKANLL